MKFNMYIGKAYVYKLCVQYFSCQQVQNTSRKKMFEVIVIADKFKAWRINIHAKLLGVV